MKQSFEMWRYQAERLGMAAPEAPLRYCMQFGKLSFPAGPEGNAAAHRGMGGSAGANNAAGSALQYWQCHA